jgi:CMP-N-acetylneuraminic acid synthetase
MVRDVLIHTLQEMQLLSEQDYHYVVLVQATSPTVTTGDIEKALHLAKSRRLSAVISAQIVPPDFNPAVTFVHDDSGHVTWSLGEKAATQRRQDWPRTLARCGLVYVFDSDQLLHGENLYGTKVGYVEISAERAIGIDSQADFDAAEAYFAAVADQEETDD